MTRELSNALPDGLTREWTLRGRRIGAAALAVAAALPGAAGCDLGGAAEVGSARPGWAS